MLYLGNYTNSFCGKGSFGIGCIHKNCLTIRNFKIRLSQSHLMFENAIYRKRTKLTLIWEKFVVKNDILLLLPHRNGLMHPIFIIYESFMNF